MDIKSGFYYVSFELMCNIEWNRSTINLLDHLYARVEKKPGIGRTEVY